MDHRFDIDISATPGTRWHDEGLQINFAHCPYEPNNGEMGCSMATTRDNLSSDSEGDLYDHVYINFPRT